MIQPDLVYLPDAIDIENIIGEIPKLRLKIEVRDTNHSERLERWVQVNRVSLSVELYGAHNYGSSRLIGSLGTFNCIEPASMMLGLSSNVFLSIPLNSVIIEKMLDIRDNNQQVAFRICGTITALYYDKQQNGFSMLDVLQTQCIVYEHTGHGKMPLLIIPEYKFKEILNRVNYGEIMKFEVPLYNDKSSINEALKATLRLLKHAEKQLVVGKNDTVMSDVRKALTNHLLVRFEQGERILESSLSDDWVKRSPSDAEEIYEEIVVRMQEGLRAILKITNKFLHDDNTIKMAPLRQDAEYVYFTVAHIVNRFVEKY